MDAPHRPFIPYRLSDQPEVCEEDALLQVFPYTPLSPAVTQRMQDFIRTNIAVLLQHWRGDIDTSGLLDALQPPGGKYAPEEHPRREDG